MFYLLLATLLVFRLIYSWLFQEMFRLLMQKEKPESEPEYIEWLEPVFPEGGSGNRIACYICHTCKTDEYKQQIEKKGI